MGVLEPLAWRTQIFLEAQMGLCDSHNRRCRCPQLKAFDCPHLHVLEVSISTALWGFYSAYVVNKHSLSVSLLL